MEARNGRRALGRLALVTGLVGAVVMPVACGSSDSKKTGSGGTGAKGGTSGGGGQGGQDASSGGTGLVGNGGGGAVDSGPDTSDGCGNQIVKAQARQVNVLLVVDRSGSMAQTPTGFSVDKWTAMKGAVSAALTATQNSVNYGLEIFPFVTSAADAGEVDNCGMAPLPGIQVPVEAGTTALPKITTELQAGPAGNTPTAAALDRALTYYTTGAGATLTGDKFVLLATDGGPNCHAGITCTGGTCSFNCGAGTCTQNLDGTCTLSPSQFGGNCCDAQLSTTLNPGPARCLDDQDTVAKITALATAGIKTIVVGIPGSDVYSSLLDSMAVAGGAQASLTSPMYYKVDAAGGAGALTTTLTNITKSLVTSCRQTLTDLSPDALLDHIQVLVNFGSGAQPVPTANDGGSGWVYDYSTGVRTPTVVLTGSYCTQVETFGAQSVQVILGCARIN